MEAVYFILNSKQAKAWVAEQDDPAADRMLEDLPRIEIPNIGELPGPAVSEIIANTANILAYRKAIVLEMIQDGNDISPVHLAGKAYKIDADNAAWIVHWRIFKNKPTAIQDLIQKGQIHERFGEYRRRGDGQVMGIDREMINAFDFMRGVREGCRMNPELLEWVRIGFAEYYGDEDLGRVAMVRGLIALKEDLEVIDRVEYPGPVPEGCRCRSIGPPTA